MDHDPGFPIKDNRNAQDLGLNFRGPPERLWLLEVFMSTLRTAFLVRKRAEARENMEKGRITWAPVSALTLSKAALLTGRWLTGCRLGLPSRSEPDPPGSA